MNRFPSAISRYLVSDTAAKRGLSSTNPRFHPLYRGTWYLTYVVDAENNQEAIEVSIRYIAVLGI